jgi:hypothetical protein
MRTTAASCIDAAQPIVLEQATKHGLNGALSQPAHPSTWPALLPGQRPAVVGIVRRARNLALHTLRHAGRLAWATSTIATGGTIALRKPAIRVGVETLKGQLLARWASKAIGFFIVSEALNFGLVAAEDRNPGGNALRFEQGVVHSVRVVSIRRYLSHWQLLPQ